MSPLVLFPIILMLGCLGICLAVLALDAASRQLGNDASGDLSDCGDPDTAPGSADFRSFHEAHNG